MSGGGGGDEGEFGLQIAPLLDVLFVLLLFFMVSAGSQQREGELGIRLPSNSSGQSYDTIQTPIILDITPDGLVKYNGTPVDTTASKEMPDLTAKLKTVIDKFGDKQPVIIIPSKQTRQGRVIDVLNTCSAAKVKSVAFGASNN
jgi:biopolymer transport protein ExbD